MPKLKRARYLCPVCGEPPYTVTWREEDEPPDKLPCPECGTMMNKLPPKVNNHFHPSKKGIDGK